MFRIFLIIGAITLLTQTVLMRSSHGLDDGPARKLLNSQGCKACHALEGDGGSLAVSFEGMRADLSGEEIRSQLVNQGGRHGDGAIPDFSHLTDSEREALVDFVQTISHHPGHRQ